VLEGCEGRHRREAREFWLGNCVFVVPAADLRGGRAKTQRRATELPHAQALELRNLRYGSLWPQYGPSYIPVAPGMPVGQHEVGHGIANDR
jgi:hypothetical protein